jgi:tetratricopeptide (TPR) repeat protein
MGRQFLFVVVVLCAFAGFVVPSAADDTAACYRGVAGEENIAACSRLIASNTAGAAELSIVATELARTYTRRGFLYARRAEGDDFDRAIADCSEALRLQPNNPLALAVRSAGLIRKGDLDRALKDLNEGLRLAPQDTAVHNVFGSYYTAKGDYDRALVEFNEALRLNPKSYFAYRNRAIAYEKKGEFEKALADYRVALRADPARRENLGRDAANGIERVEKRIAALHSQPEPQPQPQPQPHVVPTPANDKQASEPVRRSALVIGNASYPDADPPLTQPVKHARSFAEELRKSGYDVEIGEDLTRQGLLRAIDQFKSKITPGSIALLFFSGYGIQADRQTYLIPVDAQVWTEKDVAREGIKLESLLADMNDKGAAGKFVIVDASRRNPYERRFRGMSTGLAPVTTPAGSLVIYAAAAGQVENDDSGVFVTELTKEIRAPAVSAERAFIRTRMGVSNRTKGQQIPWISSSLTSSLRFARTGQ